MKFTIAFDTEVDSIGSISKLMKQMNELFKNWNKAEQIELESIKTEYRIIEETPNDDSIEVTDELIGAMASNIENDTHSNVADIVVDDPYDLSITVNPKSFRFQIFSKKEFETYSTERCVKRIATLLKTGEISEVGRVFQRNSKYYQVWFLDRQLKKRCVSFPNRWVVQCAGVETEITKTRGYFLVKFPQMLTYLHAIGYNAEIDINYDNKITKVTRVREDQT